MAEIRLETARLILREVKDDDAEEHHRHLNTPKVMARLGGVMERQVIAGGYAKVRAMYAEHGFGFLMMIEKETGELVGYAGIKLVDNPLAPNVGDHEIGWLVREDRWRRGYAYEAVRAILNWAFGPVGAPFVVALTSKANIGSWKLMEKLGMERRKELDFSDPDYPVPDDSTIQYSITRDQWSKTQ